MRADFPGDAGMGRGFGEVPRRAAGFECCARRSARRACRTARRSTIGVLRQPDAAGADLDCVRSGRHMGQRHGGPALAMPDKIVVLYHPMAPVA
jgi:hypothetical protein